MAPVELRDERGHLMGVLDPEAGVVEIKCRRCSWEQGEPAMRRFDAGTGEAVEDGREGMTPSTRNTVSQSKINQNDVLKDTTISLADR